MPSRRDLLIGLGCATAAASAYALSPHRHISLMDRNSISAIVPPSFDGWTSINVSDLAAPFDRQSLVDKLYDEIVQRIYTQTATGLEVMLLLAHGETQSDQFQLHRPEVCYPAFGFALSGSAETPLALYRNVTIPTRRMIASAPGRQENVIYWSRLGELMPTNGAQQRLALLRNAMSGVVADGMLVRFSVLGEDSAAMMDRLAVFIQSFVRAVPRNLRAPLVGTLRANALASAGI